jgi:hypothetical protein
MPLDNLPLFLQTYLLTKMPELCKDCITHVMSDGHKEVATNCEEELHRSKTWTQIACQIRKRRFGWIER